MATARSSLLTVDEAAEYLNVKSRMIRHLYQTGRLAFVRLDGGSGRRSLIRFELVELENFIRRGRHKPR